MREGTKVKLSHNTQILRADVHLKTQYEFNENEVYSIVKYEGQHQSTEHPKNMVDCWRLTGGFVKDMDGKELTIDQLIIPETALIAQE